MFLHSMMPFERMNGVIKGYVRNRSRPNGSIAKGFLTKECISFCANYFNIEIPVGLPINKHLDRSMDGVTTRVVTKCMSTSLGGAPTLVEQT
jgi:hypothetical protein